MKALNPYLFIHIGLLIRLLRHSQGFHIPEITKAIDTLIVQIENANFQVSLSGSSDLKSFRDNLQKDTNKSRSITSSEVSQLSNMMNVIEKIVYSEAHTKRIYILTEERYSLDLLMNHPEKLFAEKVYNRLPLLARYDLKEGFLCIPFLRTTAAAFHILRATEATLKKYYFTKIKHMRVDTPMWGNMTTHLESRKKRDLSLLRKLDYIRKNYRNPTTHPEAVYTEENIHELLSLCIDVINCMACSFSEEA